MHVFQLRELPCITRPFNITKTDDSQTQRNGANTHRELPDFVIAAGYSEG